MERKSAGWAGETEYHTQPRLAKYSGGARLGDEHRLESEAARKLCIDYALSGAYVLGLRQPFDVRFDWINDALGAVDSGAQQDVFARARLLDERGVAFREHGNPRRALDDHRLAMNISKSIPDVKVWALGNIGRALWELGKPRAATKWFKKSLALAEAQSEGRAVEGMFDCLGLASRELGRPGDAVELHTKAKEQASKIHDLRGQARALDNLGKDYLARGDKKENVIETFKKARKMAKDIHDDRIEAAVLDHLSEAHRMHEQLDEAMTNASQAVKRAERLGDERMEGRAAGNLGLILSSKGELDRAKVEHQKHYSKAHKTKDLWGEMAALDHWGEVYREQGLFDQAQKKHEEAIDKARRVGHLSTEGRAMGNLGLLCQARNRHAEALKFHQEHLRIALETQDPWGVAAALDHLTNAYEALGHRKKLKSHARNALQILGHQTQVPLSSRLRQRLQELLLRQAADALLNVDGNPPPPLTPPPPRRRR